MSTSGSASERTPRSTSRTDARGDSYHHGNLRQALIDAAVGMLERGENFSLRAVAREAGVSQTAPYRHFADRSRLESAVAAEGFHDLAQQLFAGRDTPETPADLPDFAVAYVQFALRRPHMFRLMFGTECDDSDDERVQAAGLLHTLLATNLKGVYPTRTDEELSDLATGLWSTAHGLACLHLDGKLSTEPAEVVPARVRAAFTAVLGGA